MTGRSKAYVSLLTTVLLTLTMAAGALAPAGAQDNLLANAGFETGDTSGWDCPEGQAVTSPARSGSHAGRGNVTDTDNARCAQTVSVQPGTDYTLSAWVQGSYVYLGVDGGPSTWTPSASDWAQMSVAFNSGAQTEVTVYLHGWYGQPAYHADDVALLGPGGDPDPGPSPDPTTDPTPDPTTEPTPDPTTDPDPGACTLPAWDPDAVYTAGDEVSHDGREWRAKWWTQGEEPGTTGEWGVWEDLGPCEGDEPPLDDDPPDAPTGLTVTGTTSSSVSLSWSAIDGADSYVVTRDGSQAGTTSSTSFTDAGLSPSTSYTYTVRARNTAGDSPESSPVSATTADEDPDDPGTFTDRRVGYFTQWGIYGRGFLVKHVAENGSAEKLTHINYAFGNISDNGECYIVNQLGEGDAWADYQRGFTADESVDGVGDVWDQELKGNFNQLRKLKEMLPHLKVHISLGGWTWSKNFSDAALTAQSRQQFVASCIDLYLRGDLPIQGGEPAGGPGSAFGVFDGIDLDWEWPASEGHEHNTVRPEDKQNFTALVAEFRSQLDAFEAETGRSYGLTAFLPADPNKIEAGIEVSQLMGHFDFVTVQGYDFHGAWESTTNHQSNLFPTPGDPSPITFSVDTAIQEYLDRGAPAGKLVVGLPYYGRGWTGVPAGPNGDGLFQSSSGPAPGRWEAGINDYKVLKDRSGQRFRDSETGALWLYDGSEWWSYDDPQLLTQKMGYIKQRGLGGAMVWSLDGDDAQGSLIDAIDAGLS